MNIAVLDIGTQTFRIAVLRVEVFEGRLVRGITPVVSILRHVRLGENTRKTGLISEHAMKRGLDVLTEFHEAIERIPDLKISAVGTHVLRAAQNARDFLDAARRLGFEIHVIDQQQEAALTALGVRYSLPAIPTHCCIMDLGGGSAEFSVAVARRAMHLQDEVWYVGGVSLGCVSLLEQFSELRPPCQRVSKELTDYVTQMLSRICASIGHAGGLVVAGGAATALASLALGLDEYNPSKIRGFKMGRDLLTNMWAKFSDPAQQEWLKQVLLHRFDILPAGIFILLRTIELLDLDEFVVSDSGLLFGLFIKAMLKEHLYVEPSHTSGIYI